MDNFFTGSHANVAHHLGKPNFELLRHDIVEPILLEARGTLGGPRRRRAAAMLRCSRRAARSFAAGPLWRAAQRAKVAPGRRPRIALTPPPAGVQVDQIYHLACPASPVHYKYNPVKTIKARRALSPAAFLRIPRLTRHRAAQTNVLGTLNMLGLAKRVKARAAR